MTFIPQEMLNRKIQRRRDEIKTHMVSNLTPITGMVFRETMAYETYEEGIRGTGWHPISVGEMWGGGKNAWFKMRIEIPSEWKGKEVAAFFKLGSEACAFINGTPYQGLNWPHNEMLLTKNAKGGEVYDIVIDGASHMPWVPGDRCRDTIEQAHVATRNPEVEDYYFNLDVLLRLAEALPMDSPRRAKIIYTLNKSVDAFDYTHTDEASLRKSAIRANRILKPLLEARAGASATNVVAHGHSHIDVAWLWPYRETKRKCARTFSTVMRHMEQYPDYIFSQSQAQLYEYTKDNYPGLYAEIKERVKEGRWDVTGSMWVEADCNLSSGESLVRQVLVAKNFFLEEFGVETDVLWLPDVFGYAAALPQILKKARVNYFSTIKINWSQFDTFPYSTFYWTGIDGTSILSHFPPTTDYNANPDPAKLIQQVREFKEKDRSNESLLSYGWGDGGGGPERSYLEYLMREKDLEGLPRVTQKTVSDFFHSIDQPDIDYPKWVGELYLELHRGTYTTQAHNKRFNRKAEFLYRDAEILCSVAASLGQPYPYQELLKGWKDILCNQFHDVIPGSSIRQVYEDTDIMYPEIIAAGEKTADKALGRIAENVDTTGNGDAVIVFNTLPWHRTDVAEVELPRTAGAYSVIGQDGRQVPSQIENGHIRFLADAPSMGYAVYRLVEGPAGKQASDLKVSKKSVENRFFKVELDRNGVITSLIEKSTGREVLPNGEVGNRIQLFEDKPVDWPAWDIDFFYEDKWDDITDVRRMDVVANGPVYAAIEFERKFEKSMLKQRMIVYNDIPRIDFETWVDWHEDNKVLKVAFPVDVNASKARYEIQFGNTERPTHTNTSWDFAKFEVCAQKWADLSEADFGMSLMNDCKYGYHTKGNVMRLTLLRSPKEPDPMADMGEHVFTYSIMPHAGDYCEAGTVRQAYSLNVPLRAAVVASSPGKLAAEKSFVSVDAPNVVLETVKRAEKEETTILRCYECHNRRSHVTINAGLPFKHVYECDLMEDNLAEVPSRAGAFSFDIKPFAIRTFKLV